MKNLILKIIVFFLAVNFCNYCLADEKPVTNPIAYQGIIDLRSQDLFKKPVALNGEWCFFWNKLLSPGDPVINNNSRLVYYPSLWKDNFVNGKPLSSRGYATYCLTVLLPKQKPSLAFELPDVYASYAFYVNGKLLAKNGQPGKSENESTPFWSTQVVSFRQESDTLNIVLQTANFWHAKGGTYKNILLGNKEVLSLKHNRDTALDLLLTGCLFMGGLFFLGLYFFSRHDKAIFYFSLFCIVYSYRLIGTDMYVLHSLFPNLSWFITVRLEYLSLALGLGLFAQYTRHLYPEDANHLLIKILTGLCGLFSLLIILTPAIVFTYFINPFLIIMFPYTAYAIYVYIMAAKNKRGGSIYALLSTAVMMLIFLVINLNYFSVLPSMKAIVFAGYIIFFFFQSLALSHRFAISFKKAAAEAQEGLKIKSEFLSTMSHEIRTPLNSVIGMTHLLLTNKPREDQKENLNVLHYSANNLLSIVNNILDYNKIEGCELSFENIPFDLAAICRNIISGLKGTAAEKKTDLQLIVDKNLNKKLIGDPMRTGQVINNLVQNAVKFTDEGWVRLCINVSLREEGSASISISVEDTGIGISPEKQQMIFELFTQADSSTSRNFGGTGLGLAITKKILELQGVKLMLKSEPGKGSIFYFTQTFAVSNENAETEKEITHPIILTKQRLKGLSILLVEDNPLNIMVAQTILEKSGAEIDIAHNGQQALDKFDRLKHQLILMDLNMPVMDGYEATKQFRKRGESLPIIALTASTPKEVQSAAYNAGITNIVIKPFVPEDLQHIILQYVQPAVSI
jgi:signal transduction histidine kinase/CheY-like chemotaxis protein